MMRKIEKEKGKHYKRREEMKSRKGEKTANVKKSMIEKDLKGRKVSKRVN